MGGGRRLEGEKEERGRVHLPLCVGHGGMR